MKTSIAFLIAILFCTASSGQQYGILGGTEGPYKNNYKFTIRMDEQNKQLIFETDAPVTVVSLQVFTKEQYLVRKGDEYTNTHTKSGNKYYYDLKQPQLKNKHVYWLKVAVERNGVPFAEYLIKETAATITPAETPREETTLDEEIKDASGATIIRTNATCPQGKTKLINALKALDGVEDVKIDAKGEITIRYSSDGTPYTTLLSTINENGFDANNSKTMNASANPCTKKATN